MNFKGFDDWIEIFEGGKQTDSSGREHDGDDLIDKAVASFDSGRHEPPLVVGHPVDNSPAFGWVEGVKTTVKNGKKMLLAKFKQVVPEFAALAEQGLYKKRSAAFYADGRLRHVGFLGGAAPAVKGLADIGFEDSEETVFQFNALEGAQRKEDVKMTFKEFMEVFKFWKQVEENPELEIGHRTSDIGPRTSAPAPAGFSEADLEQAKKLAAEEAAKAERKKVEAEFAEKSLQAQRAQRGRDIDRWYDDNLKAGKVIPAWDKSGLREFMKALDGEEALTFAEGADQISRLEWFKGFMAGLPKVVEFGEVATREKDITGKAGEKLSAIIQKKMNEKQITYGAAFAEAQMENPDLAREYARELKIEY